MSDSHGVSAAAGRGKPTIAPWLIAGFLPSPVVVALVLCPAVVCIP